MEDKSGNIIAKIVGAVVGAGVLFYLFVLITAWL